MTRQNRRPVQIDRLDAQLLEILQEDSEMPLHVLSSLVHASPATCNRRIAKLKTNGVIRKSVAIVDRFLVGRPLTVFVSVELDKQNDALLRNFEKKMAAEPSVMACHEVSGEFDFFLIISASTMEQYHDFTREIFSSNNNIRNFKSTFAMNCSKFETKILVRPSYIGPDGEAS